jgi:putative tricarboxylic transport membrane protein
MRRGTRAIAVAFLLLGVYVASQGPRYGLMSASAGAGPGMLPLLAGLGMMAASIAIIFFSSSSEPVDLAPGTIPERSGIVRMAAVVLGLIAVVLVMERLGYIITMFVFLISTMWLLGRRDPLLVVTVALGGSLGVYWIFTQKLSVALPRGVFGF